MNVNTLENAIAEAKRFIKRAERVEIIYKKDPDGELWSHIRGYTKKSAACLRASLDLSRALSERRKTK